MTASVTSSPRYCSASRFSFCRMRAEISCGVYFLPSISVFQSVPMWRLTEAMVRSTFVTAWRLAVSPTSVSPSLVKATTDGVVRKPSAFAMTVGSPPSRTATTEFVVPRSIPTARAMCVVLPVDLVRGRDMRPTPPNLSRAVSSLGAAGRLSRRSDQELRRRGSTCHFVPACVLLWGPWPPHAHAFINWSSRARSNGRSSRSS